jgi:hypothetical protein
MRWVTHRTTEDLLQCLDPLDLAFLTASDLAFLAAFAASGVQDPLLVADGFFTCIVHGFVIGLLGNPVNRVGRLLELWLGEQTPMRLCIVLVGVQQPIQPTVQKVSGRKLALLKIIPPKLERVNF